MGRKPTKAASNPFCQARLAAAHYNERLFSKEGAAEFLGISVSTLSDYELGITKIVPPDMVLKMADLYNAPELRNYYCREMCPLGEDVPVLELEDLDRITVRAMASLRKVAGMKESLLDITADGKITEDEKPELRRILTTLDEIASITQSLKVWTEKNLG